MKAQVPVKTLRFLQLARVPVVDIVEQEVIKEDCRYYPIVNGVMLVPVTDAEVFGLNEGTLRNKMCRGQVTRYNEDGTEKRGSGKGKTFWDPYEVFNNR